METGYKNVTKEILGKTGLFIDKRKTLYKRKQPPLSRGCEFFQKF